MSRELADLLGSEPPIPLTQKIAQQMDEIASLRSRLAVMQKALEDAVDTIGMHTLPVANDVGCYALVNRCELDQMTERAKSALAKADKPKEDGGG